MKTMNVYMEKYLKISLKPSPSKTTVIKQKSVADNVAVVYRMGKEPMVIMRLLI